MLLNEERGLPVAHMSRSRSGMNQERVLVELRRCTNAEVEVPALASYQQSSAQGVPSPAGWGVACLRAPWHSGELLPSKHGSRLRQSCRCLLWINNLNYRGAVGQNFPALAVLWLFNLLFSLMISEPGGISRRGDLLPSCSLFPRERLQRLVGWGAKLAEITPTKEGTSGRCFRNSWV